METDETLSLNQAPAPLPRSRLLRLLAALSMVALFSTFALPLIDFIASKETPDVVQYTIAIAQTLTLCWALGHALAVTIFSSEPFSHGIAFYVITMMTITTLYVIMQLVTVIRGVREASSRVRLAEIILLSVTLSLMVATGLVAFLKREMRSRKQFGKSIMSLNIVSLIVAGITAALATTALVLDYKSAPDSFHFPMLMFPNMFDFTTSPSITSILSTLLFLGSLDAVPYTLTIMRIAVDQQLTKSDRLLSILALIIIVSCQITVFICCIYDVAHRGEALSAPIALLCFVTGLVVIRGVFYSLYVTFVVDKQIRGQRGSGLL